MKRIQSAVVVMLLLLLSAGSGSAVYAQKGRVVKNERAREKTTGAVRQKTSGDVRAATTGSVREKSTRSVRESVRQGTSTSTRKTSDRSIREVIRREADVYDRRDDGRYERDDRRYDDRYRVSKKMKGPKFCQDGGGHPVHGREWCYEKGYGYHGYDPVWDRRRWDDAIFRVRSVGPSRLERRSLGQILGDVLLGRLDSQRRYLGYREPLYGYWRPDYGSRGGNLWVYSGSYPVAMLVDANGDRRIDYVMLNRAR